MMNNELVSVIITTYKRPTLLKRALESVLNQTYVNIEIIVVDDNNPNSVEREATEELMSNYTSIDRIVYKKMTQNSGSCVARNYGVSIAQGRYINFLDDDDEFFPTKIEKQMDIFTNSTDPELSVVGCFAEIVNQDGNVINTERTEKKGNVFFDQLCQNVTTTSLALIRKDYFIDSGGFEKMYSSQEHWMFAKIYATHPNYNFWPEILVRINIHNGARISTNTLKPLGAIQLYDKVERFIPRFDKQHQDLIRISLLDNIINAYLTQGRRKESFHFLILRQKYGKMISISNFKILLTWVLGVKLYAKIVQKILH